MKSRKFETRIDGMKSLFTKITQDEFVILAINSSYFFDAELVKERHTSVLDAILKNTPLPARYTRRKDDSTTNVFTDEITGFSHPIIRDAFGNNEVIKLINKETGYVVARINSNFPNYVISHIWAKANDPRYFTSFWNLVLIPAWANHLMDKKDAPQGSVASILHSTIKKICFQV